MDSCLTCFYLTPFQVQVDGFQRKLLLLLLFKNENN